MKAVRVTTVETRAKAARVLDLREEERVVKPEKRENKTWSPTWKVWTQIGQFPLSSASSATTSDSNAWREEF